MPMNCIKRSINIVTRRNSEAGAYSLLNKTWTDDNITRSRQVFLSVLTYENSSAECNCPSICSLVKASTAHALTYTFY